MENLFLIFLNNIKISIEVVSSSVVRDRKLCISKVKPFVLVTIVKGIPKQSYTTIT